MDRSRSKNYFVTFCILSYSYLRGMGLHRVKTTFHQRLQHPPKVKVFARVSSRVPFFYLNNKQPNLAYLSDRLTSSSDYGNLCSISQLFGHSSFFCGDVIAITSWAPDVVNLVRPTCSAARRVDRPAPLLSAIFSILGRSLG